MPVPTHLLERAYQLIDANQLQNAELVLDAVVRVDPQNVEAWMAYLRIHQNQNDLDWLKERVLKTKELNETDKTELVNYYHYLTQHLDNVNEITVWTDTSAFLLQEKTEEIITTEQTIFPFELIDVFDYPARTAKKEPRTRPRRRTLYNPIAFDITSIVLKAISRYPTGKKTIDYIQKTIALVNDFAKNPQETFKRFSEWAHFEKSIGITLLILFVLGVRLAVSNHFLGYVFLGLFVSGSGWWLVNFGGYSTAQSRVYLHENKIVLPVIEEVEQEEELGEEDFEKIAE